MRGKAVKRSVERAAAFCLRGRALRQGVVGPVSGQQILDRDLPARRCQHADAFTAGRGHEPAAEPGWFADRGDVLDEAEPGALGDLLLIGWAQADDVA